MEQDTDVVMEDQNATTQDDNIVEDENAVPQLQVAMIPDQNIMVQLENTTAQHGNAMIKHENEMIVHENAMVQHVISVAQYESEMVQHQNAVMHEHMIQDENAILQNDNAMGETNEAELMEEDSCDGQPDEEEIQNNQTESESNGIFVKQETGKSRDIPQRKEDIARQLDKAKQIYIPKKQNSIPKLQDIQQEDSIHEEEELDTDMNIKEEKVEFFCEVCGKHCDSQSDLVIHNRVVHGRAVSVCDLCGAQFKNSIPLYIHAKHAHKVIKDIRCVCGNLFNSVRSIKQHYEVCRVYQLVNRPGKGSYMCHVCGNQFTSESQYTRHLSKHQSDDKIHTCKVCGQSFKRASSLYNHEKLVHHDPELECPFCRRMLKTRMGILYHVFSHKEIQMAKQDKVSDSKKQDKTPLYTCPLCAETSVTQPAMKFHILSKHKFNKRNAADNDDNNDNDDDDNDSENSEIKKENKDGVEIKIKDEKNKDGKSEDVINMETFAPTCIMKCEICGRICPDRGAWRDHMALHAGEVTVVCSHCNRGFVTRHAFRKHMRTVHNIVSGTLRQKRQSRYVECEECGRNISRTGIAKHMDMHRGIYRYKCDLCGKLCRSYHDLTVHRRMHTGEKPFKCSVCDRDFSDQANLTHHQQRVHQIASQPNASRVRKTGFHKKFTAEERAAIQKWEEKNGALSGQQNDKTQVPLKGKFENPTPTKGNRPINKTGRDSQLKKVELKKFVKITTGNELASSQVLHVVSSNVLKLLQSKGIVNMKDVTKISEDANIVKVPADQSDTLEAIKRLEAAVLNEESGSSNVAMEIPIKADNYEFQLSLQKGGLKDVPHLNIVLPSEFVIPQGNVLNKAPMPQNRLVFSKPEIGENTVQKESTSNKSNVNLSRDNKEFVKEISDNDLQEIIVKGENLAETGAKTGLNQLELDTVSLSDITDLKTNSNIVLVPVSLAL